MTLNKIYVYRGISDVSKGLFECRYFHLCNDSLLLGSTVFWKAEECYRIIGFA